MCSKVETETSVIAQNMTICTIKNNVLVYSVFLLTVKLACCIEIYKRKSISFVIKVETPKESIRWNSFIDNFNFGKENILEYVPRKILDCDSSIHIHKVGYCLYSISHSNYYSFINETICFKPNHYNLIIIHILTIVNKVHAKLNFNYYLTFRTNS